MAARVDDLFAYAFLGDLPPKIDWLARLAAPEDWQYHHAARDPGLPSPALQHPALVNYLRYTFKRLVEEGKLLEHNRLAAFNTGLLTPLQEEIFAILEPNEHAGREPWYLTGFVPESDRRLAVLPSLPERAQYFDDPAELIYDFRRPLRKNLNHIIEENRERFPEPYRSDAEAHRLRIALEGAVEHALRRVRQKYKTAVPQFYWPRGAERGQLQLLLPLCLSSPSQVDVALTVYHRENAYISSTVLTLEMAYNNARLIARPDSDWLTP